MASKQADELRTLYRGLGGGAERRVLGHAAYSPDGARHLRRKEASHERNALPAAILGSAGNRQANGEGLCPIGAEHPGCARPNDRPVAQGTGRRARTHGNERYLVAAAGRTEWSRNLRATGSGRLTRKGHTEEFDVVEVPVAERPPLIEAYLAKFGRYPTVGTTFRQLPDPADHPAFRIVRSRPVN